MIWIFCIHWFTVYIKTDDIYQDNAKYLETRLDTSNYELDRPLSRGKKTGLTKDELGIKKIMTKFVGLKKKTYSYLIDDCSKDKKAKGIIKIKCVIKRKLKFKYYKICLEANQLVNTVYYLAKMKLT